MPKIHQRTNCKICHFEVTEKTGVKCQGACQCWIHFQCLSYTPGKIKDIQDGLIKITCPCPDCKTTRPREYLTDKAKALTYKCNNDACPVNLPMKCVDESCPSHINEKMNQAIGTNPWPVVKCSTTECRNHDTPQSQNANAGMQASSSYSLLPSQSSGMSVVSGKGGASPSLSAIEELCNTVGQLTEQLNDIMGKIKEAKGPGTVPCPAKMGTRAACPKPCYCPGNPMNARKR